MRGPALVGHPPSGLRWSGDGARLYFEWQGRDEEETATWLANADGSGLRRLTDDERRLAPPVVGQWDRARRRVLSATRGDIALFDTVAGTRTDLTRMAGGESSPRWARNESHVTFVRDGGLFLLPLAGGGVHQIAESGQKTPDPKKTESQEALAREEAELLAHVRDTTAPARAGRGPSRQGRPAQARTAPTPDRHGPATRRLGALRLGTGHRTCRIGQDGRRAGLRHRIRVRRRPERPRQGRRCPEQGPARGPRPRDPQGDLADAPRGRGLREGSPRDSLEHAGAVRRWRGGGGVGAGVRQQGPVAGARGSGHRQGHRDRPPPRRGLGARRVRPRVPELRLAARVAPPVVHLRAYRAGCTSTRSMPTPVANRRRSRPGSGRSPTSASPPTAGRST